MKSQIVIIEKAKNGFLGRVIYKGDMFVTEGKTLAKVEEKMNNLLRLYGGTSSVARQFTFRYDLSSLFEKFAYLKISSVAELAGVNASLLRQYVTGSKHASSNQALKIQQAIHRIAGELAAAEVYSKE